MYFTRYSIVSKSVLYNLYSVLYTLSVLFQVSALRAIALARYRSLGPKEGPRVLIAPVLVTRLCMVTRLVW